MSKQLDLMNLQVVNAHEIQQLREEKAALKAEVEKWRRIRTPTHGSCCTCQACGLDYDACRCDLDEVADELAALKEELEAIKSTWNETAKVIAAKALENQAESGDTLHEALSDAVYGSSVDLALEVKDLRARLKAAEGLIPFLPEENMVPHMSHCQQVFSGDDCDCGELGRYRAALAAAHDAGLGGDANRDANIQEGVLAVDAQPEEDSNGPS